MKRVLIIEDEILSFNRLKRLIGEFDDTIQVDGPITTVEEVVSSLKTSENYDLIFSDIRLQGRLVFEAFQEVMPQSMVVFTTAYDEYALDAFRHNGVDYLLKPIDPEELSRAMAKVKGISKASAYSQESIRLTARELKCYRERFLVAKGDELIPLRVENVSYFRKEEDWVMAYKKNGDSYRLSKSMTELEEQLNPEQFFRLNRQYIAHIDGIQRINFFFSSKLAVRLKGCDDDQIIVSKEKSAQFKEWLDR